MSGIGRRRAHRPRRLRAINGDGAQGDDPADGALGCDGHHRAGSADVDAVIFVIQGRGLIKHMEQRRHVDDGVDAMHGPPERSRVIDFRAGVRVRGGGRAGLW